LNEKEAYEIREVLGIKEHPNTRDGISELAREIHGHLDIDALAVHPVTFALAVSDEQVDLVEGPYVPVPLITTGAGDHFNAGFCLGKLFGLHNALCVLVGVTTSGYYVRTGRSPSVQDVVGMLRDWPTA